MSDNESQDYFVPQQQEHPTVLEASLGRRDIRSHGTGRSCLVMAWGGDIEYAGWLA